jgi:cell division protein FtsI (penicillin-binding protein 3)
MKSSSRRIGIVHASLALLMLAVLGKAAHVQLVQGRAWSQLARRQHYSATEIPASRGLILDAGGRTLAASRDLVRLDVAAEQVRDPKRLRTALMTAGVDQVTAARAAARDRAWVVIPGRFVAEDVAPITAMRGVYTTPVSDRAYSAPRGLRSLVGVVDAAGRGIDGLELALDSLLRGTAGASRLVRDGRGRSFVSPTEPGQAARTGHTVLLTINHELQEIAERTLAEAVRRMRAEGGDIVILDPRRGELLALAGERHGVPTSSTVLTEPFEPGSTLKPLMVAGLLGRGKARLTDKVPARGGSYKLHGRTVNDEPHDEPTPSMLTLADVVRLSSNVGMVQFAERFDPREQYETLRDFGLGTPTGLPYPSEAAGTLRPPHTWSKQSSASLSLGYEIAVTPIQLAMAYAAIANGGELLEPALVKEIKTASGDTEFRHERRVVRRVMTRQTAAAVRKLLTGVVERGTGVDADLDSYRLAGKTGTPRRTVDGHYAPMQYNPNFVGLFPAEDPQLVVVVKIGNPKGDFYGGSTAAPMTKTIVQAALAARDAAIDRSTLTMRQPKVVQSGRVRPAAATASTRPVAHVSDTTGRAVTVHLPPKPQQPNANGRRAPQQRVPNLRGLSLRDAVRSLHFAGFRVQLVAERGASSAVVTDPPAGSVVAAGSLVRLRHAK